MKTTPLHELHQKLGARMGEFGGWDMPIQYAGILQEHEQTRSKASVFDICHMGEFELSGESALADLERLLTCNIGNLRIGQVRYGFMLNDDGCTIDDLTCYRLAEDRFMLVVNAGTTDKDSQWIQSRISGTTQYKDLSDGLAKLDVQGPKSRDVLEDVFGCTLPDLGYFKFKEFETGDGSIILSRTGYTGEWGYELYLPNKAAVPLWSRIIAHDDCEPGGLGARDTLRLEMGYSLYGHELSEEQSPAFTSRGMFIFSDKDFIGKNRVLNDLADLNQMLVGLKFPSKRAAREKDKVYSNDTEIGIVSSGSLAPSLGHAVAMAFIGKKYAVTGTVVDVEIRNKRFSAEVTDFPFYKKATARG